MRNIANFLSFFFFFLQQKYQIHVVLSDYFYILSLSRTNLNEEMKFKFKFIREIGNNIG